MFGHRLLFPPFGVGVLIAIAVVSTNAQTTINRTAYLTFSAPVALPGVSLGTGTYAFELADPLGDLSFVRVSSRDKSKVYYMGFTELVSRPPRGRSAMVSFGEAASGMPVPISVWYPPDGSSGRRFLYRETDRTTAARLTTTR